MIVCAWCLKWRKFCRHGSWRKKRQNFQKDASSFVKILVPLQCFPNGEEWMQIGAVTRRGSGCEIACLPTSDFCCCHVFLSSLPRAMNTSSFPYSKRSLSAQTEGQRKEFDNLNGKDRFGASHDDVCRFFVFGGVGFPLRSHHHFYTTHSYY